MKFATIQGQDFIRVREASKLSGLHPVVLEMGQKLLSGGLDQGAAFQLGTPQMQAKAGEIQAMVKTGLRRVAKAFKPNVKLKVKTLREPSRLVFWYSA